MSECTHDCSSCSEKCASRSPESFLEKPHEMSKIKKVIGVVSGKGGVGKSLVTALLSVISQRAGFKTGILDADITGPSVPKMFKGFKNVEPTEEGMYPAKSKTGIEFMSINLLLENDTDPVIWRGPVIAGAVKQFWTDVIWSDVDFMFVDMPPGTGDVPLTVFQSLPIDGIIIVTSPQDLVSMIVGKALKMANLMNIPVLGIVENYSYFNCPDCGKKHYIYGESKVDKIAEENGLKVLAKLPINPEFANRIDNGDVESIDGEFMSGAIEAVENA